MARRVGFVSVLNAIARDAAKKQRQFVAGQRQQMRLQIAVAREIDRSNKLRDKADKQRYLEARIAEVEAQNEDLNNRITELWGILEHTLSVDDAVSFGSLRVGNKFTPLPIPNELTTPTTPPVKQYFFTKVAPPSLVEKMFGMKQRFARDQKKAEENYEAAYRIYENKELERKLKLDDINARNDLSRKGYDQRVQQRDQEVDELESAYKSGDVAAVVTYNSMVLDRSEYPDGFPQKFRLAYVPESKELVIEYELPNVAVVPDIAEYKYVKSKDEIETKPRKAADIKEQYQDIVAAIALRTIHEVLEADHGNLIHTVVFSGIVETVDVATGKDIKPCLLSLRATREQIDNINLARVDKRACLRNLGAHVSPQPHAMQPVKPVVEFDMVDRRFVEQGDILGAIESRPNLMDLSPTEFEILVSNLFQKMGLETKLTRASRDGGVDAVAYDTRPVLGGKVVIQAKRYKNTVGVSAVRDLYGTMMNEGANKGIIVTTSGYGPDAYEFSKDKPIECIDGGGLLYLLQQVGISARIVLPENAMQL